LNVRRAEGRQEEEHESAEVVAERRSMPAAIAPVPGARQSRDYADAAAGGALQRGGEAARR